MIEIKEELLESKLAEAIHKIDSNRTKLISITRKINAVEPLHFFENAKQLTKDRTFWSSTADQFYIVGVGKSYTISAEANRFQQTEKLWESLLQDAIIDNPFQVPGTGLLSLGGMSFDPDIRKSRLWEKFGHSLFTVPEYMLTVNESGYFLTVNVQADERSNPGKLADSIKQHESLLLNPCESSFPDEPVIEWQEEIAPRDWMDTVKLATETINQGDADKIVLARELRVKLKHSAGISAVLDNLIYTQSNSYIFAFEQDGDCFVGATPERLAKVEGSHVLSTCLAGTAPRGETSSEDNQIAKNLLDDEKNRSEHEFVVSMIKHAMEHYCTDIKIPDAPVIYPLKNLQHLFTPVTAKLSAGYSIFDIIGKLHPTPALGGVPRKESIEFIREHEQLDRGWYGAPIGWLDSNGNGEFAVAIRSGLIQGDEVSLFAGCGVVKDSDPMAEYEETAIKFTPMLSVLGG
ncbi:isochorismate synthase [Virgibacillus siamensis]|uniref:isochorismate synthase n=1 Tax=Virgibacillus siamensis TaxID=480071 RepID=UPI000984E312|nr:isochorismate synthase [Virgibacillus siamensis]